MSWPLVGREEELRQIAELRDAGGVGVVLQAPAGVGKSRLAHEALARAAATGAQTAWVQATRSAATVPLAAFAGLMPAEVRSDDRLQLMRRSAERLRELGGSGRLVLAVDDAQLLDATSATLVLHLTSTSTVFLVATVRSGEPSPDAIVSLWKDVGAKRIELEQLGERETAQLVEAIAGGPVEQRAQHWVWESSRGNALFVRELIAGALADGALEAVRGLWRLRARPSVSGSLAEVVEARVMGLSAEERRLLELLALGEPLRVGEALQLSGSGPVAALETHGLISVGAGTPDAEVRLVHPLYGDAIGAGLPSLRATRIRTQLATTLQAREECAPEDALRIARLLLDAGEPIPAELMVRAARTANLSGDPELAEELARRAVAAGAGIEAVLLLARAFAVRNLFEEAAEILAAAESAVGTQDEALAFLDQQTAVLYWGLKRIGELRALLERARDWWPDEAWQRRLAPLRLNIAAYASDEGPGVVAAESQELLAGVDLDPQARRRLEGVHLRALFYAGRGREAYALGLRLRPVLPWRDLLDEGIAAVWGGIVAESGEGWREAEAWASRTMQEAVGLEDRGAAGVAALALGNLRFTEGRFLDARRWLSEAELHQERHDPVGLRTVSSALQAGVAFAMGDRDGTIAALARCRSTVRGDEPLPAQLPYLLCAEAWATGAEGERERARQMLLTGAERVGATPLTAARLAYEAMRLGAPARVVAPRLAALDARSDASLPHAQAAHAAARAAQDGPGLLRSADAFVAIGALRYACEAAAHAAEAFAAPGLQDSARRAAARSAELFAGGQGGTAPVIEGVDESAVQLTPRERELVELAALGLANTEIAERLVLSVRTVESHLYRAMQKLGIGDRRELAGHDV
jgi:DNA-binding CsgD family transcriptional regulator